MKTLFSSFPFPSCDLIPLTLTPSFREEAPPSPPPPVVYSRYADDTLRYLVKKLKERTETLREKAADPYASSPEISPPVSKYQHVGQQGRTSD